MAGAMSLPARADHAGCGSAGAPSAGRVPARATVHGAADRPVFNGDAFDDLAVGVPGEDVSTATDAGAVNVIYGSLGGLDAAGDQFWTQGNGLLETAEAGDQFGAATAAGDFDGDGFGDLAVGAPGEDVGSTADAGAVSIIFGSSGGLATAGNQVWTQDDLLCLETSETGDQFGAALRSGDFDGDGFSDLAIGIPFEDVGLVADAGSVAVLYGSSTGLTSAGTQVWTQNSSTDPAETGDQFGAALAGGASFDSDSFTDLAVGVPGEDVGTATDAGAINVLYGSGSGLTSSGNQFWTQKSTGIADKCQKDDAFGAALTSGQLDDDAFGDLVVGVPGEEINGKDDVGAISIIFGTSGGLSSAGNKQWSQDSDGVNGKAEVGDQFGAALRTGKFDGDAIGDVAIGVPGEDVSGIVDAGQISVLFGSASGPNATGDQMWNQDSSGISGKAETGDAFGTSLKAGNFDGDQFVDIAVGAPGEGINGQDAAGLVNEIFGDTNGFISTGNATWTQDKTDIEDASETGDSFGFALA